MVQVHEVGSAKYHEIIGEEDFLFQCQSLTVRWNNVDLPPFSRVKALKLYAMSPLFFDCDEKPVKNR